jgi:lipoyl(octanoyl) transferase
VIDRVEHHRIEPENERVLRAFLLGRVELEDLLVLQRRLGYEVGGEPNSGTVILCDHAVGITIGREGSLLDVRPSLDDLQARELPVRWMSRGGGTMLHVPGQVVCYPVFALAPLNLTPAAFLIELSTLLIELLGDYGVSAQSDPDRPGIRVGKRRLAHLGIAVRGGVSCFGMVVNVDPDLELFRDVACDGDREPMTSLQREVPTIRVRVAAVRQRLVELLAARFRFTRVSLFHTHPVATHTTHRHATTAPTR